MVITAQILLISNTTGSVLGDAMCVQVNSWKSDDYNNYTSIPSSLGSSCNRSSFLTGVRAPLIRINNT